MLHEGNENIKLILNEINQKNLLNNAKYFTFLYWQTLTLYERVSVFDQGEGPWVHAPSLIIYLKENKAFQ